MIPSVLPTYNRAPLTFVKGEGTWLIEADGRRFLDLGAGIAVNALGHAHPALVKALKGVDEVAYVRYASVYKDFRHTGDFAKFLGDEGFDEPSGKS